MQSRQLLEQPLLHPTPPLPHCRRAQRRHRWLCCRRSCLCFCFCLCCFCRCCCLPQCCCFQCCCLLHHHLPLLPLRQACGARVAALQGAAAPPRAAASAAAAAGAGSAPAGAPVPGLRSQGTNRGRNWRSAAKRGSGDSSPCKQHTPPHPLPLLASSCCYAKLLLGRNPG